MTYRLYLYILTQLATRKFVVLPLGNHHMLFRIDEENGEWKFSLKLASLNKQNFSHQLKQCFSTRNSLTFHDPNTYLTLDNQQGSGVYLNKKMRPLHKYLLFKQVVEELLEEADDFKELLWL